ncbi:MAG: PqqD family protein [Desulfobaccales bacterium]
MDTISFLTKRFAQDPTYVYRRIADECLLVPIRQQVADLQYIYVLNPVANRIWELLDGKRTMAEVRDQILEEFEVGPQELEQDLLEYIEQLREIAAVGEV